MTSGSVAPAAEDPELFDARSVLPGASAEAIASFEEYERLPKDLRDVGDDLAADGVRYVPYIEGVNPKDGDGAAANTSYTASRVARALHQESRGMLGRNMASQRSNQMTEQ